MEESYGDLVGTHARDKDAVSAAMMITEACAYFKGKGKILYQVLQREIDGVSFIFDDFAQGLYGLPKSDVLRFKSETGRLIIRPSGTEPKMKIYLQSKGKDVIDAQEKNDKMQKFINTFIK